MATELKLLAFPENMKIQKYELQITNVLKIVMLFGVHKKKLANF